MNRPAVIDAASEPRPFRLRIEDFEALWRAGAFVDRGKVELIGGELLCMSPQHLPHARAKSELHYRLRLVLDALGDPLAAIVEGTVSIPPDSAPEPDIVLIEPQTGTGTIPVRTVRLVVEISASTRDYDLGRKARLYAGAGVPEYWVFDLADQSVLRLTDPRTGTYAERTTIAFGDPLAAVTVAGLTVATAGLG